MRLFLVVDVAQQAVSNDLILNDGPFAANFVPLCLASCKVASLRV